MRVLICGSRDWGVGDTNYAASQREAVSNIIGLLDRRDVVIHGGARGADSLAGAYARLAHISVNVYTANWKEYGRRAGPIRNQNMLDLGRPEVVIYFTLSKDEPTRGTADMVERARKANKPVFWYADYKGDRFGMAG